MFFIVILSIIGCSLAETGCGQYAANTETHSRCVDAELLKSGTAVALTQAQQNTIVDAHNKYRATVYCNTTTEGAKVYPSDLMPLEWNADLAETAQYWAQRCTFGHDESAARSSIEFPGSSIGQNGAFGWVKGFSASGAVDMWYNENYNFLWDYGTTDDKLAIGHFTQVVHNGLTSVGCGLAHCVDSDWETYLFCNYNTGNMGGAAKNLPFHAVTSEAERASECNALAVETIDEGKLCGGDCFTKSKDANYCGDNGAIGLETCGCVCKTGWSGDLCDQSACTGLVNDHSGCEYFATDPTGKATYWDVESWKDTLMSLCKLQWCLSPPDYTLV